MTYLSINYVGQIGLYKRIIDLNNSFNIVCHRGTSYLINSIFSDVFARRY